MRIVALGSSSTEGTGATSRATTYPARLEAELRRRWPDERIEVINAGVGGQLARHMVARLEADVIERKPQLVVWQTGVNDAIAGVSIDALKATLVEGISRMQSAGIDVVLLDQQYYPRFERLTNGADYLAAVRDVAETRRVPVIQRFRIMKHLVDSAQFTAATLLAPDQFHLNDRSYECLGALLADSLQGAVTTSPTQTPALPSTPTLMPAAKAAMSDESRIE